MKSKLLLLALAFTPALAPLTARAEDEVSYEFFYDNLSPYGDWVEVGDYGTCWRPRDVDSDWAPYTDGYWSYTDAGWTWVSYEDFGDITYHYGRWVRTDDVGWCWVPDYEWGPAWVSWRKNDDYVGWAPLPPEARWRPSVGFSVWVDETCDIGPSYYNFCPTVDFGAPVIRSVCVPRARCISLFGGTVNITNITYNSYNRHVFCGGPDYAYVNRVVRRPVPTLKLVQNTTIINNNITIINNKKVVRAPRNVIAGNTLQVFSPKVVNKPVAQVIRPNVTQVIARPKIDKGWAAVKDPGEVARLRDKVRGDAKGLTPETAPARPVKVTDLKPLPEKADTSAPSPTQIRPRPFAGDRDRDDDKGRKGRDGVVTPATPGVPAVPGTPGNQPFIARPGRGEPKVPDTDVKPGRGPSTPTTVPTIPRGGDDDRPGKIAGQRPNRVPPQQPQQPQPVPTQPSVPSVVTPPQDRPDSKIGQNRRPEFVPGQATPGNPQRKPFRGGGGDDNDDNRPSRIAPGRSFTPQVMPTEPKPQAVPRQQTQPDVESAQRRIAEQQAERQRAAAASLNAQREAQASARREQMQAQQAAEARDAARQRQAADAAQRQAAMSRQAESQQRAMQAQRQQQMQAQRQEAIQSQRRQQQMERPQAQPQPQIQRQPQQRPPQQQPQPQVQRPPQQQPRGGGRQAPQQSQGGDDDKRKGR